MKNLFKSLAAFQQEVPAIYKDTEGYNYNYADLPKIMEAINPLMKKHGMGFTQPLDGTKLRTIIFHIETGEMLEESIDIPQGVQLAKMNDFQVLGSAITYLRRYCLASILGLVTDKDEDMAGKQKKQESIDATPKMKPEEALKKARTALAEAESLDDLNVVRKQIIQSKILTPEHKKELEEAYQVKSGEFDPTK